MNEKELKEQSDKKKPIFCAECGERIHRMGFRFPESKNIYCNGCMRDKFSIAV